MRKRFGVGVFAVSLICAAQEPVNTAPALNAAATKAYQAKDYAKFLDYEKRALALEPDNPRSLYNVACGEALTGHAAAAVDALNRLLTRKVDLGASTDDDFAGIRKSPEWADFESKLAALRRPLVKSTVAFTLLDPELTAVGIAVDPRNGDTYLSSARERKIVRRLGGTTSDFVGEAQDGFLAGGSLAIDTRNKVLYASTSAVPFMRGYRKEDEGHSGVFAYELNSAKLLRKVMLPPDGKPHFLNAMTIDRAGNLYVCDSGTAGIYRLGRNASTLESLIPADLFRATQGLAFSNDEKTLFVVDYADGLWALDLSTKKRRRVEAPPDTWLGGLDGLTPTADGYLTVQIGIKPERVLRFKVDSAGEHITNLKVLEMNHPDYAGPVQGSANITHFFYVANSQLALGNAQTGEFATDKAKPTVVLRLPL